MKIPVYGDLTDMEIRIAKDQDYIQLAEMKWQHCEEDDEDYNENNLSGIDKAAFMKEYIDFLAKHKEYIIFVSCDGDIVSSAMFVYLIPKTPKPNGKSKYIAYLTNVYTKKEYRNKKVGTELLKYIKEQLAKENCELLFVWPSDKSVNWYCRNGFYSENEIMECDLVGE